jgi:uncharacterized membrane protein required for colicin V production
MNWLDIIAVIILIGTFFGGLSEGAVRSALSLVTLLIAIPTAGLFYYILANVFAFLPGPNWNNFVGFFVTLGIITAILQLIFLVPRKIAEKIFGKGLLSRLGGAVVNLIGTGISFALLVIVLRAYPVVDWLVQAVSQSTILTRLAQIFGFVASMLPSQFR